MYANKEAVPETGSKLAAGRVRQHFGSLGRRGTRRDEPDDEIVEAIESEEARTHGAGELRARLELTERAESTLREGLEQERERADRERGRAERLEPELRERQGRSRWRRVFGGRGRQGKE